MTPRTPKADATAYIRANPHKTIPQLASCLGVSYSYVRGIIAARGLEYRRKRRVQMQRAP